jgi:hypothetical protein
VQFSESADRNREWRDSIRESIKRRNYTVADQMKEPPKKGDRTSLESSVDCISNKEPPGALAPDNNETKSKLCSTFRGATRTLKHRASSGYSYLYMLALTFVSVLSGAKIASGDVCYR